MSNTNPPQDPDLQDDELLDADEADEEITKDPDQPMDEDDDDEEEVQLQNDSAAYFDTHTDSIFCIAQHPTRPSIVVTGGGDDLAYIFDASIPTGPVLPSSYESNPQPQERKGIEPLQKLDGHKDSVNAVTFTLPNGEYVVTTGLDGQIRAYQEEKTGLSWKFIADASEVQEINWVEPSPNPDHPNVIALGANDGSVWVYQINAADTSNSLTIVQAFYLHTASCTAGAWTPDGKFLATVSEDGSLYVWDVFESGSGVVSHTAADQRFEVDGGLYSVACTSSIVAVGGGGGNIKVVGLPQSADTSKKNKAGGATKQTASSAGQILASLQAQSEGVETLSFSSPPLNLLAAGSIDGSIALFDTAHRFAVRRHIKEAHEEYTVVKVAFVRNPQKGGYLLTSAGLDGVVRRWDVRGGTTASGQGFVQEWKGHRGEGEGGGILGFVQGRWCNHCYCGRRWCGAGVQGRHCLSPKRIMHYYPTVSTPLQSHQTRILPSVHSAMKSWSSSPLTFRFPFLHTYNTNSNTNSIPARLPDAAPRHHQPDNTEYLARFIPTHASPTLPTPFPAPLNPTAQSSWWSTTTRTDDQSNEIQESTRDQCWYHHRRQIQGSPRRHRHRRRTGTHHTPLRKVTPTLHLSMQCIDGRSG